MQSAPPPTTTANPAATDNPAATATASATTAQLLKPKKELTPEQRAKETKKRAARREALRQRTAKAIADTAALAHAETIATIQARATKDAIFAHAQALADKMIKEGTLNAAITNAGIISAAASSATFGTRRPPLPTSSSVSPVAPPYGYLAGHAP
jgi:hypothetical protein